MAQPVSQGGFKLPAPQAWSHVRGTQSPMWRPSCLGRLGDLPEQERALPETGRNLSLEMNSGTEIIGHFTNSQSAFVQ